MAGGPLPAQTAHHIPSWNGSCNDKNQAFSTEDLTCQRLAYHNQLFNKQRALLVVKCILQKLLSHMEDWDICC